MKASVCKSLLLAFFTFVLSGGVFSADIDDLPKKENAIYSNAALMGLYSGLNLQEAGLSRVAFDFAIAGFEKLLSTGEISNKKYLSIIDFSQPSNKKRLYVIDLVLRDLMFQTYVAHGSLSGNLYATDFSNALNSNKSCLGFFITNNAFFGKNGFSLSLAGIEPGINDNAAKRGIVLHSASYVNENRGVFGKSNGSAVIPEEVHIPIIETIKNGSCLFIYATSQQYSKQSMLVSDSQ